MRHNFISPKYGNGKPKVLLATFLLLFMFFFILAVPVMGQNKLVVKGTVVNEKGEPLSNVSVLLAGTKTGTLTNTNGAFEITAPTAATLIFSFIGYESQNLVVGNQTNLKIILKSSKANSLNAVIVVGYGTQKKTDVTGAISSVPKGRLTQIPSTNVMQSVEGSVPGLTISSTSSVPGKQPDIMIRGQNSIGAGTGPYIVVDGIPLIQTQGGNLNDINPNDIESIQVLKDASATAIYGVRGSNGVILITTKRGKMGKPQLSYNGYTGVENIAHILTPRSAAQYIQKYADYLSATGQTQTSPVPNYSELPNYNNGKTIDWVKQVTQTGIMQDHNLTVSGGSDNVKYYVGGEYMDQKGVIKGYQYKRVNIRSNLDITITNFLKIGMSSFLTSNNYDGGRANLLLATAMSPYGNEYNADGTYSIYPMYPELLYTNPLLGLTTQQINRNVSINGNAYAEVTFPGVLKGLKYRLNAGYIYLPERSASYTGRADNDMLGTASITNAHTNNYTIENLLYYDKDWGKHHIDFTGLYSAQQRLYITATAGAKGFVNDIISFNNLGAGATQTSSSYSNRYGSNSQMGRINYNYDSRYLLSLTARRDGASVMGANTNKYGLFPSAAFGWNISRENFMKNVSFVNNLKLRASYGKTGNEGIEVYQTITTDNSVRYPFNGVSTIGVLAGNLGNANLHWESTKTFNLGLDFSLLNNRISGTIDAYKNNTYGLILKRSIPIITGYSSVLDNIGKTKNQGLELSLSSQNITNGLFKWETSVVFSTNRNRIVELYGDGKDDIGNRWFIGKPIGVIYDYKMLGVWQTGEDPSQVDPTAKAGDLKFVDLNGDHQITADDREILGQTSPKWTGGITNTFHYKNFNLNIFIQTVQGAMKNDPDLTYADESGRRNTPAVIGYWTPTNSNNDFPSLAYNNTRGYGWARNASYTRLKDVTLSYVFSQKILDHLGLAGLTIYATGKNLYTDTKWIGWDPEDNYSSRGSGDWTNNYPLTRSYVFGLNISLK
ncbi:SusC/RagA family TonB-linked outer membrane protein [Arachidicoccus sp.]|uniref:SusC/RagA family TonB-linked outer membrane protein n=1 Tax=Arachidicoccus sp. TaxID=1872624 RepID=UPI003D205842